MPVRPGTKGRCRPSPLRKPHPRSNGHWPSRAHTHGPTVNGRMTPRQVRKFCTLKPEAQCILKAAMEELGLSARAHDKVLRVERKSVSLLFSKEIGVASIFEGNRRRFSDFDGESESTNCPSGPLSSGRDPIEGSRPEFLAFINRFRYTGIIHLPPWDIP